MRVPHSIVEGCRSQLLKTLRLGQYYFPQSTTHANQHSRTPLLKPLWCWRWTSPSKPHLGGAPTSHFPQALNFFFFLLLQNFYCSTVPRGFLTWEIWVAFPRESQLQQSYATKHNVHTGYFSASITHWTLTWLFNLRRIFNLRTDVNTSDFTRECTDTVRESALEVDSGGGGELLLASQVLGRGWTSHFQHVVYSFLSGDQLAAPIPIQWNLLKNDSFKMLYSGIQQLQKLKLPPLKIHNF